jgi:hypothetical protein
MPMPMPLPYRPSRIPRQNSDAVRSTDARDHLAAILIGRDGRVTVWASGHVTSTISDAVADLAVKAIEARRADATGTDS